ncbi:uncharacterized protein L201_003228 [Kwoniella dendrophila CBS 6074]|uniref:Uncharacterized protein n=1 Tax=Kwoniella dendrophila CBS 6074 TaxID=1295534 RepID=A0AAX4JUU7_9TREE
MTNNNTPRLLPQIQPGLAFTFSELPLGIDRTPRCYPIFTHHSDQNQSTINSLPDEKVAQLTEIRESLSDYTFSSPITPKSNYTSNVSDPISVTTVNKKGKAKGKNKSKSQGKNTKIRDQVVDQGKKKGGSTRRRGESHYKRTVEKPRGPPSWLITNTKSVHPPLQPQSTCLKRSAPPLTCVADHPITRSPLTITTSMSSISTTTTAYSAEVETSSPVSASQGHFFPPFYAQPPANFQHLAYASPTWSIPFNTFTDQPVSVLMNQDQISKRWSFASSDTSTSTPSPTYVGEYQSCALGLYSSFDTNTPPIPCPPTIINNPYILPTYHPFGPSVFIPSAPPYMISSIAPQNTSGIYQNENDCVLFPQG